MAGRYGVRAIGFGGAAVVALGLAACSSVTPSGASGSGSGSGSNGAAKGPFVVGVSNGFVGSEYRTQMIQDIQDAAKGYQDAGELKPLVLENADTDVNGQIQQIRNLINKGVNAIIVNPNSGSALDAVFKEATGRGIKVFAIDQAVTEKSVINVGIDQGKWAETSAKWLAETLGNGKQIVAVNGIAGHPANEARWAAAKKVFDGAGIKVLTVADGGWDQAKGQQAMANLLATYPQLNGVWTQDGMAQGVLKALVAAKKTGTVVTTGEARNGFMRMWSQQGGDFKSIGVVNPPGTGATALHLIMANLKGTELDQGQLTDGHNVVLDLEPSITKDNFAAEWDKVKAKPDTYVLDSILSKDDVTKYLKK